MRYLPKQYHADSIKFLLGHQWAGLLLDMGLGKTGITLFAIKVLFDLGLIKRVLLIAPIRTLYTVWPEEIAKWDEFNHLPYVNLRETNINMADVPAMGIYAINPESALTLFKGRMPHHTKFDLLVIDESSQWKNPSSQRFKYLKPWLHEFPRRWILTGTPAPNGLTDIWSQIYILDRGESLGKYVTHFRNEFCVQDYNGYGYTVPPARREEIYKRIAPFCMRLSAADHIDMPDLITNPIRVRLPPEAMIKYAQMERDFLIKLGDEVVMSMNAAVAGMRCRQIANGAIYSMEDKSILPIHTAKYDALKELVEDLQGQPLLVFYEFLHDAVGIEKVLGDVPNLTKSKDPLTLVREFNEGKHPVVIGHPATIGMGLNLQGSCHNICWMGVPWDLSMHDQANARVYRQGQESDRVIIHYLMAEGTLDHVVLNVLGLKAREQNDLFLAIQRLRDF